MERHKIEPEMTFGELIRQLYRGSRFTYSELAAAKELFKRGHKWALVIAATDQRPLTQSAARYALRSDPASKPTVEFRG